jgi:hypothetical protein
VGELAADRERRPGRIRALKAQDGPELQVHGSANLIQTLLAHDLIDEFRVWIFPLVLGKGKRLFESGTLPAGLELTSSATSSTGVLMATYRRVPRSRAARSSRAPERGGTGSPRRTGALILGA